MGHHDGQRDPVHHRTQLEQRDHGFEHVGKTGYASEVVQTTAQDRLAVLTLVILTGLDVEERSDVPHWTDRWRLLKLGKGAVRHVDSFPFEKVCCWCANDMKNYFLLTRSHPE
ncbi:hypothetical protein D3C73_874600 [compost metagenome]